MPPDIQDAPGLAGAPACGLGLAAELKACGHSGNERLHAGGARAERSKPSPKWTADAPLAGRHGPAAPPRPNTPACQLLRRPAVRLGPARPGLCGRGHSSRATTCRAHSPPGWHARPARTRGTRAHVHAAVRRSTGATGRCLQRACRGAPSERAIRAPRRGAHRRPRPSSALPRFLQLMCHRGLPELPVERHAAPHGAGHRQGTRRAGCPATTSASWFSRCRSLFRHHGAPLHGSRAHAPILKWRALDGPACRRRAFCPRNRRRVEDRPAGFCRP
jgi:hypothetical protein